jgi:flagellar hook protein FlgE
MMTQAFYTGISGLKAGQTAIDVTANNVANISTTGFRAYKAEFSNLFEDALVAQGGSTTDPTSIGYGTKIQATSMVLEDGSYSLSDRSTDLALEGDGWFGVQGEFGFEYTRAGNFTFDRNSDLISGDGNYVLGTMGGNIDYATNTLTEVLNEVPLGDIGEVQTLRFPQTLSYPAIPSSYAQFYGNIGTDDEIRTVGADIIDAQSNHNHLKLTFTKSQTQNESGTLWDVVAVTQSTDGETVYDTKTGTVTFGADGGVLSTTLTTIDNNGTEVEIDLGSGFEGLTAIENTPISSSSSTNGSISGDLVGYDINRNAEVIATFSNGFQSSVGQIAVFHFNNNQGLERASGANFFESSNSGPAYFKKDANGNNIVGANVTTFRLENSNVAIEQALTELIILQRSYDANSKSITTADQMMQKALNMDA